MSSKNVQITNEILISLYGLKLKNRLKIEERPAGEIFKAGSLYVKINGKLERLNSEKYKFI